MNSSLDENTVAELNAFLQERPPRASKLDPWTEHIFHLLAHDASYNDVAIYLKTKGVKADKSEVRKFTRAKKRAHLFEAISDTLSKRSLRLNGPGAAQVTPENFARETQAKQNQPTNPLTETQNKPRPNELPKLKWDVSNKSNLEEW